MFVNYISIKVQTKGDNSRTFYQWFLIIKYTDLKNDWSEFNIVRLNVLEIIRKIVNLTALFSEALLAILVAAGIRISLIARALSDNYHRIQNTRQARNI